MKTKTQKKIVYAGLGFPVVLQNVELVKIEGEWHPKIDIQKVADAAIEALAAQETRLTGSQIQFIRKYLSMSLREFGKKVVKESHAAVKKWEDRGDEIPNMDVNIEIMLRLYLFDEIILSKNKKNNFHAQYRRLRDMEMSTTPCDLLLLHSVQG